MENFSKRTILERLKIELQARGISLRKLDELMGVGKRQIFQPARDRPLDLDDILSILQVAGIEPSVFFGQVAGYGHPLEIGALRVKGGAKWPKDQNRILRTLRNSHLRGARGFEAFRSRLRELEHLREEDPSRADAESWAALTESAEPGAWIGLLSMLAINAPRAQAHDLLQLATELLCGELKSVAGAKLAFAAGRCFINASLFREGLSILENFALPLAARYGAVEDQAAALIHIGHAEAALGSKRSDALWKAVELGDERLSFAALQVIAGHELNLGDIHGAADMYDELVAMPYFKVAPRVARAAINCSRLAAHFIGGRLGPASVEEFRKAVSEARTVLSLRDQVNCLLDFVLFLSTVGRDTEAQKLLEAELWKVLDLEDQGVRTKFVNLWVAVGLPKDSRLQTLKIRIEERAEKGRMGQPPGSQITPISSSAASGAVPRPKIPSRMSQRVGSLAM